MKVGRARVGTRWCPLGQLDNLFLEDLGREGWGEVPHEVETGEG